MIKCEFCHEECERNDVVYLVNKTQTKYEALCRLCTSRIVATFAMREQTIGYTTLTVISNDAQRKAG